MKVLITGSSGFIGSALVSFFEKQGDEVYKLVRARADILQREIAYDPERGAITPAQLEGFDAIVHLAGESIMGRWTLRKKNRILESRVKGTTLIAQAISKLKSPPPVFISASATGYYGDRKGEKLDEETSQGKGFLAEVCAQWEKATEAASNRGVRVVNLRIGMVLSDKGGALKQMLPIFKLGLGGEMGPGDQVISWISIDDLVRIVDFAINQRSLGGVVNAVTPYPVTNRELTKTLGDLLHRPTWFSMPTFMVHFVFGQLGQEILLSSGDVAPKKLERADFQFQTPRLEEALSQILKIQ